MSMTKTYIHSEADWFCCNAYEPAGRPKMEEELRTYARLIVLYRLVAGRDFGYLVRQLNLRQESLAILHPNWKKCKVYLTSMEDDVVWLNIGASALYLRKVKGNF